MDLQKYLWNLTSPQLKYRGEIICKNANISLIPNGLNRFGNHLKSRYKVSLPARTQSGELQTSINVKTNEILENTRINEKRRQKSKCKPQYYWQGYSEVTETMTNLSLT